MWLEIFRLLRGSYRRRIADPDGRQFVAQLFLSSSLHFVLFLVPLNFGTKVDTNWDQLSHMYHWIGIYWHTNCTSLIHSARLRYAMSPGSIVSQVPYTSERNHVIFVFVCWPWYWTQCLSYISCRAKCMLARIQNSRRIACIAGLSYLQIYC